MRTIAEAGLELVQRGYEPLPIAPGEKRPTIKGWSKLTVDQECVEKWVSNGRASHYVGLRTGRVVAVDIDIDDAELTERLVEDASWTLGEGLRRVGKPGRALLLYRVRGDEGRKSVVSLIGPNGGEHAVEVLARGQQFVAYGQHPSGVEYDWIGDGPAEVSVGELAEVSMQEVSRWLAGVADLLPQGWSVAQTQAGLDDDERWLSTYVSPSAVEAMEPIDRVNYEALRRFDAWVPDLFGDAAKPYQGGYRVSSQALGRALQEDLSLHPSGIRDHGEERGMTAVQVVGQWGETGDPVGWLADRLGVDVRAQEQSAIKARQEAQRREPGVDWSAKIAEADTVDRLDTLAKEGVARDRRILPTERGRLVQEFVDREKELSGRSAGKRAWARLCEPPRRVTMDDDTGREMPDWCKGWCYIGHTDRFYNALTGQELSIGGFNAFYGRHMPADENGVRPQAAPFALHDVAIMLADLKIYAPQYGAEFVMSGQKCVNAFVPDSVPEAAEVMTDAGNEAARLVEEHVMHLCGNRLEVSTDLMCWIAYCVQNMGHKIRYAPLIKGIEGDGKTLLLLLLSCVLGQRNVSTVAPQVLLSSFNGYAEGSAVVGLEEVRIAGHNRHEALNALKPLVTNTTVDIHRKGIDAFNALNVTNYIAFTNHGDALPLSRTDRRWFVISTPWADRDEMERMIGCDSRVYFDRLTDAIQTHGAELRRYLLDYEIPDTFNPNGGAPMTPEKESMRLADSDTSDDVIEDLLAAGAPGVSQKVISTSHLRTAAVEFAGDGVVDLPVGRALSKLLSRLGWSRVPKRIKWRNEACRVWVRGIRLDNAEAVRQALDETDTEEFG